MAHHQKNSFPKEALGKVILLPPFSSLMGAEGINILIKCALNNGHLKGLEVGQNKVIVSHLQYADDMIFLGKRSKRNASNISKLLSCFEELSGLKVNRKSNLYSLGVPQNEVNENNAFWTQIISSIYGPNGGLDLTSGNGKSTLFWYDTWLNGRKLKESHNHLFNMERNKLTSVADRLTTEDSWKWLLDNNGSFATKILTGIIDDKKLNTQTIFEETVRNKAIPQKINIFSWREKMGRLPTRSELDKRGIDLNTTLCPLCNDHVENLEHALTQCHHVKNVWTSFLKWWNLHFINVSNLNDALISDQNPPSKSIGKTIWQA
ncbi:uncharacterized protein [Rutidosis leptorrhynchoides]|uniref:uncharacterized protein n=1 Tax=Rutidosis leptorrhynchoides TaxID=125765 RepID=UPI003A98F978